VTKSKREENIARPNSDRAFLSRRLGAALPSLKTHLVFWPITTAGLALDLWTKKAVFGRLQHGGDISIIDGFLRFVRALNAGAAFGMFAGHRYKLIAVSIIALIASIAIFFSSRNERKLFHVGLALFTAGICGNLYDRIFNNGLVRDFIDVVYWPGKHWPAFNVGDSMLCIGVGVMFITLFTGMFFRKHAQQHK